MNQVIYTLIVYNLQGHQIIYISVITFDSSTLSCTQKLEFVRHKMYNF